ncbi:TPA: oligosaccharide flippase family protein, partial [Klebsiella pneumoniae]|nr:oligosaccharide flippase family protein [Klebsiella pneumoniae]
ALILRFKFFDKKELRTLLAQAVPIFISTLIVMIYTRIDQFMVVKFLGVEQVALFNVAIRISDAYMFIPIAIAASFFPMVSKDATNKSIKQYFYITHLFTVLSAMFILVLTPIVISVFFGERYSGSIQVVYIIVIANV